MIIGCAVSSSTFFYVGSIEGCSLIVGAAESVGLVSNSKSISIYNIYLFIGAWLTFGFIVISASTFLA